MKRSLIAIIAIGLLGSSAYVLAQSQVVLKTKPVSLQRQGDIWIVPEGTTSDYYSYSDNGTEYVCTRSEPKELVGVKGSNVKVRMGTSSSDVVCYKSSYFVSP